MEQVQQLIDILKDTPEMALWGIGLFFLWTLLKLASVVSAITLVIKLAINKTHSFFSEKERNAYDLKLSDNYIRKREIKIESTKVKNEALQLSKDEFVAFLKDISISSTVHKDHWRKVMTKIHRIKGDYPNLGYMHKHHMDFLLEVLTQLERGDIKLKTKDND